MLVLGLSGNFSARDSDLVPLMPDQLFHDSAACLVRDGEVIAAVEEERFNRIKKTTKFPVNAIRACLDVAGVTVDQLDGVAYYFPEDFVDTTLNFFYTVHPKVPTVYCRQLIKQWFAEEFNWDLGDDKLVFTPHHDAHAIAAVARSGIPESLVLVLDGRGEENSGTVYRAGEGRLEKLADYPVFKSLGMLYLNATQLLGYGFGDEYKVMGLAPYGDPATFRDAVSSLYLLGDKGDYNLLPNMSVPDLVGPSMLARGITPRRKGEPFTQQHKDFAAATQEALEKIVLHVLTHWAESTGLSRLCFGGGVAHNSTLNGNILRSGLFREVFVHPASHDAGASEGAAFLAADQLGGAARPVRRSRTASSGPALGTEAEVRDRLGAWGAALDFERHEDIVPVAAGLLADGAVLGWAQGRSEFGPRALGNRSIIADARPAENQTRINAMVKQRESYRPFAPVVTAEAASDYFDLPATEANYDFMSYVVPVREERRPQLGAVTHIDGTARVQVVDPVANERFHRLVAAFGERTGTPVLLNTSFNNNAEPIVQTIDDVVTCFLTTDLDYLVVEDFLVRRRSADPSADLDALVPRLRPVTRLARRLGTGAAAAGPAWHEISLDYAGAPVTKVSEELFTLLSVVDGVRTVGELAKEAGVVPDEVRAELYEIWQQRYLTITPA
ncbi:carbamoyltransferase C-terminal domain-containing protein [Streptomyces neyagawaensis]|uniref:Putative carbamoyltransferase n=2 Tax=Streptomyces neyagawaensis TaxID=42238 RepID=Q3S874_9ACTN|nr:carbamoyltransferase C-terminal domain-containing protein [Streptomyces neyagawaensis]AAZ94398.1 putative carbamoyltransferase [Streptomyces neyagawaensis]MCL6731507.1 carbamoyltransferase [Streptomyces neyagawaensis]MDE1683063.1 carbamoyltransferase C-terminal domain-containing protein [Streptomyces neyagawaensis]